jgi:hypothetical protein
VGKPEGKRPLRIPARRLEDSVKMDLQEVGWTAWTGLFWSGSGRWWTVVNVVMNVAGSIK